MWTEYWLRDVPVGVPEDVRFCQSGTISTVHPLHDRGSGGRREGKHKGWHLPVYSGSVTCHGRYSVALPVPSNFLFLQFKISSVHPRTSIKTIVQTKLSIKWHRTTVNDSRRGTVTGPLGPWSGHGTRNSRLVLPVVALRRVLRSDPPSSSTPPSLRDAGPRGPGPSCLPQSWVLRRRGGTKCDT